MAYATDQYGRSQAMIDAENASVEDTLMLEYLRYKGFDLKSLVQTAAQTQRVQSLRDRIKKSVKVGNSGQHSPEFTQQDPSGEGVSLDNIL
jgi:hypothetical protein